MRRVLGIQNIQFPVARDLPTVTWGTTIVSALKPHRSHGCEQTARMLFVIPDVFAATASDSGRKWTGFLQWMSQPHVPPAAGRHVWPLRWLSNRDGRSCAVPRNNVYEKPCIHFERQRECDVFLESNEIREQALVQRDDFLASRALRAYRKQRGKRDRILADFLVEAHAQEHATRLISRDLGFYRTLFLSLDVRDPSGRQTKH